MYKPILLIAVLIAAFAVGMGVTHFWSCSHGDSCRQTSFDKQDFHSITQTPPKELSVGKNSESVSGKSTIERIVNGRNLSLYDNGGNSGCGIVSNTEYKHCIGTYVSARAFLWNHWQAKRRGYIVIRFASEDAVSDSHIFIEPDESGDWHVVWRIERVFAVGHSGEIDDVPDIRSMESKDRDKTDYDLAPGTPILIFKDMGGRILEKL